MDFIIISIEIMHQLFLMKKKYSETGNFVVVIFTFNNIFGIFYNMNSTFTYATCEIFSLNLFLFEMIANRKKIIACTMEQHTLKNVNNCLNTSIYSYLETSCGQSSYLYLNVVHFFNTSAN
jgi:hypothetical protein